VQSKSVWLIQRILHERSEVCARAPNQSLYQQHRIWKLTQKWVSRANRRTCHP
jgi:hypothetical protein